MRWNATFQYKKASAPQRDANGFLVTSTAGEFVDGGLCQIERSAPAQHRIVTDGEEFTYSYQVYVSASCGLVLSVGDTIKCIHDNGTTITAPIVGIDNIDRKVLAIWL